MNPIAWSLADSILMSWTLLWVFAKKASLLVITLDDLICLSADDEAERQARSCAFKESSSEYPLKTTITLAAFEYLMLM